MRYSLVIALTASLVLSSVTGAAASVVRGDARAHAAAVTSTAYVDDPERDCMELVPESFAIGGVTDNGEAVSLDVVVLLDGIPTMIGRQLMTNAAEAYAPLNVNLTPRFKRVSFDRDGVIDGPDGRPRPTADFRNLFRQMRDMFGGERPDGSDAVHLVTSKDIFTPSPQGSRYGMQGVAQCIGGVRYPDQAFSMSEARARYDDSVRDRSLRRFAAKVAAHELGHLMGAHHHYGNCVEGNREPDFAGLPALCTLMSAVGFLVGLNFGTLEATVVRGHAVGFASP